MARKRMEDALSLDSWEDVDKSLKDIAECEIQIGKIEGDLNASINELKEKANNLANVYKDKITEKEKLIKAFVSSHKSELDGKTKTLTFGQTGFRKSESISIPRGKDKQDAIIDLLRKNKMEDCINIEESINKDALRKYNEDVIIRIGASVQKKDTFWYEVNLESVK